MTELPVEFKPLGMLLKCVYLCNTLPILGIGPRKFRTNIPESGDRSVWTDTPADLLRKAEVSERR